MEGNEQAGTAAAPQATGDARSPAPEAPVRVAPEYVEETANLGVEAGAAPPVGVEGGHDVDLLGDDDELPQVYRELAKRDSYKVDRAALEALPTEAKVVIAGLRNAYSQKGREVAEQRRELDAARREIAAEREALRAEREAIAKLLDPNALDTVLERGEPPEDEFGPAARAYYAQEEVRGTLQKWLEHVQGSVQSTMQAEQAKVAEAQKQARFAELREYAESNPDFVTHKDEIIALRRKHPTMDYREAHQIVAERHGTRRAAERQERLAAEHRRVGSGSAPSATPRVEVDISAIPKDPEARYRYLQQHPEVKRALASGRV